MRAAPTVVPSERPGPEGGKRDANRRARAEALGSAALALMLDRGVQAVSIDEIVSRAGVAKGSFYRYFEDKTALVAAIVEPLGSGLVQAFDRCREELAATEPGAPLLDAYARFAGTLAAVIFANEPVARLYLQERRGPDHGERAPIAALARRVDEGALALARFASGRGLTRPGESRVSAAVVVGAVEHLAALALAGDHSLRTPAVALEFIGIILEGVRATR